MLSKLIIIENGENYGCETLEDVVKLVIDKNYYNMSDYQKKDILKIKASANLVNTKFEICEDISVDKLEDLKEKFIIKNEYTFILSLLMNSNRLLLLEKKDSDIFTKLLNKENVVDNYIIVNTFAGNILLSYIQSLNNS